MDMTGERRIPAPRQKVWDALNDPETLRAAIPGCKTLEKTSDNNLKATAGVKIGPISAAFTGKVRLLDLDPPNSYRIAGEGQGGVAGFANGGATVHLSDDGAFTLLKYEVKAQVGGKIAQLGARLIDATAKQMADQFFDRFSAEVSGPAVVAGPAAVAGTAGAADWSEVSRAPAVSGQTDVPGRPEVAADGAVGVVAAIVNARPGPQAPAAVNLLAMIPKEPFGYPIVFWIGSVIFLVIFFLIFGSYIVG